MAGRSISPSSLPDWKPPPTLSKLSPPPPHIRGNNTQKYLTVNSESVMEFELSWCVLAEDGEQVEEVVEAQVA